MFFATPEEHEAHLRQLFQKLHDAGLKINLKKTVLGRAEVKFCGYLVSDDGIRPPHNHVGFYAYCTTSTTCCC